MQLLLARLSPKGSGSLKLCRGLAKQKACQAYLCPAATRTANEESKAIARVTKYIAQANALETHTQGAPNLARIVMLETSVREAKCGTRANKHESHIPNSKLETHALWCMAYSVGKEHKACARKHVVYLSNQELEACANKHVAL